MNHRIISLLILLLSLGWSGCQKFSRNFDSAAKTCGMAPDQLESLGGKDPLILQLSLVEDDQRFIKANLLQNGQWQALAVSPGACVIVPSEAIGHILLENTLRDSALWLNPAQLSERFQRVELKARKPYSMRLGCNSSGFAAREAIDLDAFYAGDGEAQAGLWVSLSAESRDGRTILLHDAALQDAPFPGHLNVRPLPEGEWVLKGRAGYRKGGESIESLDLLGETRGCPLQILRKDPVRPEIVAGTSLSGKPPRLTLKVDEPLLVPRPANLRLEACVQAIPLQLTSCESCSAGYSEVDSLRLQEPGLFAAYFRFRDAAGNRSASSCATIQASGTAPQLGLAWSRPEWNQPFPLLEKPLPTIRAQVTTLQHENLTPEQLEATLECKLTLTNAATGQSRPAYYSRCLSGRCAGQTFRDWVPCSRDITMDMTQEWMRPENWESSLNLSVRASDGVGHGVEARRNLWFSSRNLAHARAAEAGKTEGIFASKLIQLKDRRILINHGGRLLTAGPKIIADPEVDAKLGGKEPTRVRILEDDEGLHVWGLWTLSTGAVLGRRTGEHWQFDPTPQQGGPGRGCEDLIKSSAGLICVGKTSIAVLQKDQTWMVSDLGATCETNWGDQRYAATSAGRYWLCSSGKLLFQAAGQRHWTSAKVPESALQSIDRIYAQADEVWTRGDFIFRGVAGNWQEIPEPKADFTAITGTSNGDALIRFASLPDGRLRLGFHAFDRASASWQSLMPDGIRSAGGLVQDVDGGLWTVIDERALLRFYPESQLLPLEMIGVNPSAAADSIALDGTTVWAGFSVVGAIQYRGDWGLYKVEARGWQTLAFGFTQHPAFGELWRQTQVDDAGAFVVRRDNGDILRLDPREGWTIASTELDRPSSLRGLAFMLQDRLGSLLRGTAQDIWRSTVHGYELLFKDTLVLIDRAQLDADGRVWSVNANARVPFTLYQLQPDGWRTMPVQNLPAGCFKIFTIVDSRRLLVECKDRPVLITDGRAESVETLFPEVNFATLDGYNIIALDDPKTPWILLSVYDRQGQRVIRHHLNSGEPNTLWSVPNEQRLQMEGDMLLGYATFQAAAIHPTHTDRFLLRTSRYLLRPAGSQLVVAADAQRLMQAQGVAIKVGGTNGFTFSRIDSFGEVWLTVPELGLLRFDRIWEKTDPPPIPSSEQAL